jgi:hypothetical protein
MACRGRLLSSWADLSRDLLRSIEILCGWGGTFRYPMGHVFRSSRLRWRIRPLCTHTQGAMVIMAKITETRKTDDVLLFNADITIEPIYFQTLPSTSSFTCATASAVIFSSHLFSSIALVKRSVSKYALTCLIFLLSANFIIQ